MGVYSELRGFIQTYRTCGIRIGARARWLHGAWNSVSIFAPSMHRSTD